MIMGQTHEPNHMTMKIKGEEMKQIIQAMAGRLDKLQESNCRCQAINKKMRLTAIEKIAKMKNISIFKAKKVYSENVLEEFHTCCSLCCNCHFDRFSEDAIWNL